MIHKILHYCWFGRGQMGPVALKCMESWKKYCPDYQIKVWNEDNFDIGQNTFVKEAYEEKKWAFVTDYVRLYALYTEGGIYLDSDIELLKNLDDLLSLGGVVTSYQDCTIPAAIMLAEKGNVWLQDLLSYYDNRHFRLPDGTLDIMENDKIITAMSIRQWNFKMGDSYIAHGNVHLLPSAYFGPYRKSRNKNAPLEVQFKIDPCKTYAVHHGVGSWDTRTQTWFGRTKSCVMGVARTILPENVYVPIKWAVMKKHLDL